MSVDQKDIVSLVLGEHRLFDSLFAQFKEVDKKNYDLKQRLVFDIIKELSQHIATEEMVLYPAIRDKVSAHKADLALAQDADIKIDLDEIDKLKATDPHFDDLVLKLITECEKLMKEKESDLLPKLMAAVPHDKLKDLGTDFVSRKKIAPTRPHPSAPATSGIMATMANLAVKPIDNMRDAARMRDLEKSVADKTCAHDSTGTCMNCSNAGRNTTTGTCNAPGMSHTGACAAHSASTSTCHSCHSMHSGQCSSTSAPSSEISGGTGLGQSMASGSMTGGHPSGMQGAGQGSFTHAGYEPSAHKKQM